MGDLSQRLRAYSEEPSEYGGKNSANVKRIVGRGFDKLCRCSVHFGSSNPV